MLEFEDGNQVSKGDWKTHPRSVSNVGVRSRIRGGRALAVRDRIAAKGKWKVLQG